MDRAAKISFLTSNQRLQASTPTAGAFHEASQLDGTPTTLQKLFSPLGDAKRVGRHAEAIRVALRTLGDSRAVRNSSCKQDLMDEFMKTELIPECQAHVKQVAQAICQRTAQKAKEEQQARRQEVELQSVEGKLARAIEELHQVKSATQQHRDATEMERQGLNQQRAEFEDMERAEQAALDRQRAEMDNKQAALDRQRAEFEQTMNRERTDLRTQRDTLCRRLKEAERYCPPTMRAKATCWRPAKGLGIHA